MNSKMDYPNILDGKSLTVEGLIGMARAEKSFEIDPICFEKLVQTRKLVDQLVDSGKPIYGLTTGLGSKVTELLSKESLIDFSYQTLRGRAHAIGEPINQRHVRGAMIIRLNTLLIGASGVSPAVCEFILEMLDKNLTPVIGEIGSIGASDLCWGAVMGLAFIGEGEVFDKSGNRLEAKDALDSHGISPLLLKPKDGLVLANHSSFTASLCAFAFNDAANWLNSVQLATAMSMQALGANLSPLDKFSTSISSHKGVNESAAQLRRLLNGSHLFDPSNPIKIQDPLSVRNAVQVHGAVFEALSFAQEVVEVELNASSDNPVVDMENERMMSTGNYFAPQMTLAMEVIARAVDQTVVAQLARMSKLLSARFSHLPQFLAKPDANSNGFAPVMKIAEALLGRIKKELAPVSVWTSNNADGVEDIQTHAPLAAQSLSRAIKLSNQLCAIEIIMACQARDLGQNDHVTPEMIASNYDLVRAEVPLLTEDRPMNKDIETIAKMVEHSRFNY